MFVSAKICVFFQKYYNREDTLRPVKEIDDGLKIVLTFLAKLIALKADI